MSRIKQIRVLLEDVLDGIRDAGILILWLLLLAIPVWIVLFAGLHLAHWIFG